MTYRSHRLLRLVSPILLLAGWEIASALGLVSPRTLPSPIAVLAAGWQLSLAGTLWADLAVSLCRVALGLAIGLTLGAALALIAGLSRLGEAVVDAPMQMLRALPFVGLVPVFILWFGIGETPKVALVAFGSVFPVYIGGFSGIRGADPRLVEMGRVCGLSPAGLVRWIILPAALPQFLIGLRLSCAVGWLSLVVGEQINASGGIGLLIADARDFLRTDVVLLGLLIYALLGLATDAAVRAVERRALRGRPSLSLT